ncbi:MAG: type III secretion system chaperone [Succinivibrio sp.]|nr:type III secretion system chaperone [Succinivibrio sp.]
MDSLEDYRNFLQRVRESSGLEQFSCDDSGLVSVRIDDRYTLNLQYVEGSGQVFCFVEMCTLTADTKAEVYRELLTGALFGRDTAGGYFTLDKESETVVYNYMFTGEQAFEDVQEFVLILEKIVELCDLWTDRLNTAAAQALADDRQTELNNLGMMS